MAQSGSHTSVTEKSRNVSGAGLAYVAPLLDYLAIKNHNEIKNGVANAFSLRAFEVPGRFWGKKKLPVIVELIISGNPLLNASLGQKMEYTVPNLLPGMEQAWQSVNIDLPELRPVALSVAQKSELAQAAAEIKEKSRLFRDEVSGFLQEHREGKDGYSFIAKTELIDRRVDQLLSALSENPPAQWTERQREKPVVSYDAAAPADHFEYHLEKGLFNNQKDTEASGRGKIYAAFHDLMDTIDRHKPLLDQARWIALYQQAETGLAMSPAKVH